MSFLGKMAIRLCSHALIFLVLINHILGHSNEISFVFKFQVDLEKHKNKLKMEGPVPYVKYSSLSNKRAAHLINFLKNSSLHALITTCTFINFEKFSNLHVYSFLHVY